MFHERYASINRNLSERLIRKYAGDVIDAEHVFGARSRLNKLIDMLVEASIKNDASPELEHEVNEQIEASKDVLHNLMKLIDEGKMNKQMESRAHEFAGGLELAVRMRDELFSSPAAYAGPSAEHTYDTSGYTDELFED